MKSFVIVQPHMEYGGAERQTLILANSLVENGYDCHVVLHEARGGLLGDFDERVEVHDLGLENHLASPLVSLLLHRTLKRIPPSLIIVKLWSSILACAPIEQFNKSHIFNYCEDLDPSDHAAYIRLGRLKQKIIGTIFRRKKYITANTRTVAESMASIYRINAPLVIPSVVDQERVREASQVGARLSVTGRVQIATVGSLIERKGILSLAAAISDQKQAIDWHIVGEGPLYGRLTDLARAVAQRTNQRIQFHLHGGTSNPYGIIRDADFLLHGAASEAFGIVIVEALTLDTPVVAASAIGSREIKSVLGQSCGSEQHFLTLFDSNSQESTRTAVAVACETALKIQDSAGAAYARHYDLKETVRKWVTRHEDCFK